MYFDTQRAVFYFDVLRPVSAGRAVTIDNDLKEENILKRIFSFVIVLAIVLFCITPSALADDKKTIGIVIQKENGAFLDMKQGILNALAENGYTEETAVIDYQCAQGDATALSTICNSMDGYDLVFCIATPATQQFVNLESSTPCSFAPCPRR